MFSIRCDICVPSCRGKEDTQKITKIKPLIDKYNWEEMNYSTKKDDWKKFGKNN